MPSVEIPGRIVAIEYDDGSDFEIVALTGANPPTVIEPSGKSVTIVAATPNAESFKMDIGFAVGDVVEIYKVAGSGALQIFDENNNDISPTSGNDVGEGAIYRKIASGSAPTWGRTS